MKNKGARVISLTQKRERRMLSPLLSEKKNVGSRYIFGKEKEKKGVSGVQLRYTKKRKMPHSTPAEEKKGR